MRHSSFEWHEEKNRENLERHGISFEEAQYAFMDEHRIIIQDEKHSQEEERLFCIGKVKGRVLTVRFTHRNGMIRIFGAAEWRKWRKYYEQENRYR